MIRKVAPITALIILITIAAMLPLAYSKPMYMAQVPQAFKDQCTLCHTSTSGMNGLNPFGADFERSGHSISSIGSLDSDGDGYSNAQELSAGTYPGDPKSYPGATSMGIGIDMIVFLVTAVVAVVAVVKFVILRR
ncbi:MAG: thrombospondin type 3 repeat-containing protein [Thaumarchaeota archaeon]|nr:thrombospondin type 3 repeat-containing protein [Nitrososphaerota archaeon]MCL5318689.1 thrombospondin type 3 repeat-containing protein [Nitrososphaerota archaeon]